MEEAKGFSDYFFGHQSAMFHIAGVLFALFGTLIIKRVYYLIDKKTDLAAGYDFPRFSTKRWITENWMDVGFSLIASFCIVRFIDFVFSFMEKNNVKILGYEIPNIDDQLVFYLAAAIVIQIFAHKWFRPIRNRTPKKPTHDITQQ